MYGVWCIVFIIIFYFFHFFFTLLKWLLVFLCFYFKFLVFSSLKWILEINACLLHLFGIEPFYVYKMCITFVVVKLILTIECIGNWWRFHFFIFFSVEKDFTKKSWNDAAFFAFFLTNVYLWLATNTILSLSITLIFPLFSIYFLF